MSQRNAIGVDIGGTKILAATVDETGSVLEQIAVATPHSVELVQAAVVHGETSRFGTTWHMHCVETASHL